MPLFPRAAAALKSFQMTWGNYRPWHESGWGYRTPHTPNRRPAGEPWANSAVSVCLGWAMQNFVLAEFQVEQKDGEGVWTPLPEHPLNLLVDDPNPYYDGDDL